MSRPRYTPSPWIWGAGWRSLDYQGREGGGDKYAELGLFGPAGQKIIPLRVDHYEPIWDTATPTAEPNDADRSLIAAAPDLYEALAFALRYLVHPDVQAIPFAFAATGAAERVYAALAKAGGR